VKRLGRTPAFTGPLLPNAGATLLAGIAVAQSSQSTPSRVVVVAPGRRTRIRTAPLAASHVEGDVFWLEASRLAFFPRHGTDDVRVFDPDLQVVSRLQGWRVQMTALVGATAFGVTFPDGRLLRTKLPAGPVRTARQLPSQVSTLIVAVG
jgi:hypothetical protein